MKLILSLSLALALTGCANISKVYEAVSTSNVPPKAIYVAINGFDVAKASATNYLHFCAPNPAPAGCNDALIKSTLIPSMKKGTVARNDLKAFVRAHPGELGPVGTYRLLTASTEAISSVVGK